MNTSVNKIVYAVFSFFVVFFISVFLLYSLRSFLYPYSQDYTEGHVFALSHYYHTYGTYFFDTHKYPLLSAPYPPVSIALASFFYGFFGETYFFGRMISFLASLGIAWLLWKLFSRKEKNIFLAVILVVAFFGAKQVIMWSTMFRPDMMAIFLSFFGLLLYYFFYKDDSPWRFLCVPMFLLAFFVKQSAIVAPLAVLIHSFFYRRRDFNLFFISYFLPLFSIIFLLDALTDHYFSYHIFVFMREVSPIEWGLALEKFQEFIHINFLFFILGFMNIIFFKKYRLFSVYFIISLMFVVIHAKEGGNINLLLEPFLAVLVLGGLVFFMLLKKSKDAKERSVLYFLLAAQFFFLIPFELVKDVAANPLSPEFYRRDLTVAYYVEHTDGPVISEDLGMLVQKGKDVYFEPFTFKMLLEGNRWDGNPLARDCREGKFPLVIAGGNIEANDPLMGCVCENYILMEEFPEYDNFTEYRIYILKSDEMSFSGRRNTYSSCKRKGG